MSIRLLRKADIAMYAVKDSGRNGVLRFSSAMNTATAERWRLETALHRALERQELVLYYQPKINVVSGQIVGAEALMRWKRGGELVPPGRVHHGGRRVRVDRADHRVGGA